MTIAVIQKSLFEAPPRSILLHACNCRGSWGGGIALTFREKYPESYRLYKSHCESHTKEELLGTTQLITCPEGGNFRIACLFTSDQGGRKCDSREEIVEATRAGLLNLKHQVAQLDGSWRIAACKFNSGIFRIPWSETLAIIEEVGLDMDIYVP